MAHGKSLISDGSRCALRGRRVFPVVDRMAEPSTGSIIISQIFLAQVPFWSVIHPACDASGSRRFTRLNPQGVLYWYKLYMEWLEKDGEKKRKEGWEGSRKRHELITVGPRDAVNPPHSSALRRDCLGWVLSASVIPSVGFLLCFGILCCTALWSSQSIVYSLARAGMIPGGGAAGLELLLSDSMTIGTTNAFSIFAASWSVLCFGHCHPSSWATPACAAGQSIWACSGSGAGPTKKQRPESLAP